MDVIKPKKGTDFFIPTTSRQGREGRKGSLFLLALGVLTILFLIGFAYTYFGGETDHASGLAYEQEVSFTLAESAIEEFLARIKEKLNVPKADNHLFELLRKHVSKLQGQEWPLKAEEIGELISFTRKTAKERYGINVDNPEEFKLDAVLTFEPLVLEKQKDMEYGFYNDPIEKLALLKVVATVAFKGNQQSVEFTTRIKVVSTVITPFADCTLYIKDGSHELSNFNTFYSKLGRQERSVTLDHSWDAYSSVDFGGKQGTGSNGPVENALSDGVVPPGRVFIGNQKWETQRLSPQEMQSKLANIDPNNPPDFLNYIALTNGGKVNEESTTAIKVNIKDAADTYFLKMDFLDDLAKVAKGHNQAATTSEQIGGGKKNILEGAVGVMGGLFKSSKLEVKMVGTGAELFEFHWQRPGFGNWLSSYQDFYVSEIKKHNSSYGKRSFVQLNPNPALSGLHLFGTAPTSGSWPPPGAKDPDMNQLSPTVVYGPNFARMFRVVSLYNKKGLGLIKFKGAEMVLPYVHEESVKGTPWDPDLAKAANKTKFKWEDIFPAFIKAKLVGWEHLDPVTGAIKNKGSLSKKEKEMAAVQLAENFDNILGESSWSDYTSYKYIMSGPAFEPFNSAILYLLGNLRGASAETMGKSSLAQRLGMFAVNDGPGELKHPWENIWKGGLFYAMDGFILDFLMLNKATEDFHRGRMTIGYKGREAQDRFHKKYVKIRDGLKTLELNGILSLSDSEPLTLENLVYKGKGIIYNSPNLAFGSAVIIKGDLVKQSTKLGAIQGARDLLTIVSPEIIIDTRGTSAKEVRIEAMLISAEKSITILGDKPVVIIGGLSVPYLNTYRLFQMLSADPQGEFNLGYLQGTGGSKKSVPYGGLKVKYDPSFHVRSELHTHSTPNWQEFYIAKIVPEKFSWDWKRARQ